MKQKTDSNLDRLNKYLREDVNKEKGANEKLRMEVERHTKEIGKVSDALTDKRMTHDTHQRLRHEMTSQLEDKHKRTNDTKMDLMEGEEQIKHLTKELDDLQVESKLASDQV